MTTGTVKITHIAVSKAEMLPRLLEGYLDSPPIGMASNNVGKKVILFVAGYLAGLSSSSSVALSGITSRTSPLPDQMRLCSNLVRFLVDLSLYLADALFQTIDVYFLVVVGHLAIALERSNPVLAVGFHVLDQT